MSLQENRFLGWFAGIAASLILAIFIWTFSILSSIDVQAERIENNSREIEETKAMHKSDAKLIRDDVKEIKFDIKEIKSILMDKK